MVQKASLDTTVDRIGCNLLVDVGQKVLVRANVNEHFWGGQVYCSDLPRIRIPGLEGRSVFLGASNTLWHRMLCNARPCK